MRTKLNYVQFVGASLRSAKRGRPRCFSTWGIVVMQLHKPYRTIDEQIQLLTSRGMSVGPEAKHALQREGYYAIVNGYKDQFLDRRASQRVGDDRYIEGTRFDDLYALFRFDRELRSLLFQGITPAEATLKAICSHEFTKAYPSEPNPYLNPHNYDSQSYSSACKLIDKVFRRILESNRTEHNGRHAGKAYIRHCLNDHNGQVPLWVLANDLSLGQIVWLFQISAPQVRLAVAESFTDLYADTHDTPRKITIKRLNTIYSRLVFFRNLCAHDERCYCAHANERFNESVFQAVNDLSYLLDQESYIAFRHQFYELLRRMAIALPDQYCQMFKAIGVTDQSAIDNIVSRLPMQ